MWEDFQCLVKRRYFMWRKNCGICLALRSLTFMKPDLHEKKINK